MVMIARKCEICNKSFKVYPAVVTIGGGKFCSRKCFSKHCHLYHRGAGNNRFGKHQSEKQKRIVHAIHFKGGRTKTTTGYIWVLQSDHPFANHGYVSEHRLIIEKYLGRYLKSKETVHHLGKRDDNRLNMLILFTSHSAHIRFHKNPLNVKPEEIIFNGQAHSN